MILKWKAWNIGLTCLGLALAILAVVWRLAIFPSMAKLPADYHYVVDFEGINKVINTQTMSLDEIPVKVKREQRATEVQGNVLIINQVITTTHAVAGTELTQFGRNEMLGVNRSTREYVLGYGDMDRSGQFTLPAALAKRSYTMWSPTAGRPLEAVFTGEEDLQGIRVFAYRISEQGLDIGVHSESGLPQVLDVDVIMKAEPVSGTTVVSESDTTIKVVAAPGMQIPVYVSSIKFTDDTIADMVDTAKSARMLLLWAKVYGFWLVIGVGIVLILVGVLGAIRTRPREVV